jgi:hypothetical protein
VGGPLRRRLDQVAWRELGFDLTDSEVIAVESFFERWFPIYNQPGLGPFRSQEALFAGFQGVIGLFGEDLSRREQRNVVSAERAGYCIAVVEQHAGMRSKPDPNLKKLFALMDEHEGSIETGDDMTDALALGQRLADVAGQVTLEKSEVGENLPGFELRDAVLADLSRTLFLKLKITTWPARMDRDAGVLVMRYGHAVGVCEEALPVRHAPQRPS